MHDRQLLNAPELTATANLAHLLLRDTKPSPTAKAKEPNSPTHRQRSLNTD